MLLWRLCCMATTCIPVLGLYYLVSSWTTACHCCFFCSLIIWLIGCVLSAIGFDGCCLYNLFFFLRNWKRIFNIQFPLTEQGCEYTWKRLEHKCEISALVFLSVRQTCVTYEEMKSDMKYFLQFLSPPPPHIWHTCHITCHRGHIMMCTWQPPTSTSTHLPQRPWGDGWPQSANMTSSQLGTSIYDVTHQLWIISMSYANKMSYFTLIIRITAQSARFSDTRILLLITVWRCDVTWTRSSSTLTGSWLRCQPMLWL